MFVREYSKATSFRVSKLDILEFRRKIIHFWADKEILFHEHFWKANSDQVLKIQDDWWTFWSWWSRQQNKFIWQFHPFQILDWCMSHWDDEFARKYSNPRKEYSSQTQTTKPSINPKRRPWWLEWRISVFVFLCPKPHLNLMKALRFLPYCRRCVREHFTTLDRVGAIIQIMTLRGNKTVMIQPLRAKSLGVSRSEEMNWKRLEWRLDFIFPFLF